MSQAQQQYGGQKQYMYNASMELKNQGNADIKVTQGYTSLFSAVSLQVGFDEFVPRPCGEE